MLNLICVTQTFLLKNVYIFRLRNDNYTDIYVYSY